MTVDLSYFYETNDSQDDSLILSERVISYKSLDDIKLMIAQGRPQAAVKEHANRLAQSEQWHWFDEYQQYLARLKEVEQFNSNRPIIGYDESDQPVIADTKVLPTIPNRPPIRTGRDVLESIRYYRDKFKNERAAKVSEIKTEFNGITLDGDEESQTRLTRAVVVMLAQKLLAVESVIKDSNDDTSTPILIKALQTAININPTVKWKTTDNQTTELDCATAIRYLALSGQSQSDLWGLDDVQ